MYYCHVVPGMLQGGNDAIRIDCFYTNIFRARPTVDSCVHIDPNFLKGSHFKTMHLNYHYAHYPPTLSRCRTSASWVFARDGAVRTKGGTSWSNRLEKKCTRKWVLRRKQLKTSKITMRFMISWTVSVACILHSARLRLIISKAVLISEPVMWRYQNHVNSRDVVLVL